MRKRIRECAQLHKTQQIKKAPQIKIAILHSKTNLRLRYEDKTEEERNLVVFKDVPMKSHINDSSRRDFCIDMVDRFIFKNKQITLFPCFAFIPKTDVGLPYKGVIFPCVFF